MSMLEHALEYRGRGWSVIPCEGKLPRIKWQEYTERLPREGEIRDWWERWPDANIAIICGRVSGLVVVDIDPGRGGTAEAQPPTGRIARTGGGGAHLFYQYPANVQRVPNRVGKDGVDVRADGGYVIAAPSLHKSGQRYEWTNEGDLAIAPAWVLHSDDEGRRKKKDWLTELIGGGTSVGTRNDDVARLAGYLAKKEIPPDIAETMIVRWMSTQDVPLPLEEASVTVRSVYRTASRQKSQTVVKSPFSAMGFNDYMTKYGAIEPTWLVKGWMPDATIAFFVSPPGGFKTWFTFDLAVSVATGRPFLGSVPIVKTGPVLIIQQEDFHGQVAERMATISCVKAGQKPIKDDGKHFEFEAPPTAPVYFHTDRKLRFDDAEVMDSLEALIAELKPALIIIDPLYAAGSTDNYMAKTAEDMLRLKQMRDRYGCSFLIVHHSKKSADDWDRQNMWGSQFLNAFLETGWQIRRLPDEDAVIVQCHFKGAETPSKQKVVFSIDTGADYKYAPVLSDATEEEADQAVTKDNARDPSATLSGYLDALGNGPLRMGELVEAVGKGKSSVARAMKRLLDAGEVVKNEAGAWERVTKPEF